MPSLTEYFFLHNFFLDVTLYMYTYAIRYDVFIDPITNNEPTACIFHPQFFLGCDFKSRIVYIYVYTYFSPSDTMRRRRSNMHESTITHRHSEKYKITECVELVQKQRNFQTSILLLQQTENISHEAGKDCRIIQTEPDPQVFTNSANQHAKLNNFIYCTSANVA